MDGIPITPKLLQEKYDWLKRYLKTDMLCLDEELERMPVLMQEASEASAVVNEINDAEKERRSIIYAQACARLRDSAPAGSKAPSEAQVASAAQLDPEYLAQLEIHQNARLDAALWTAMVDSMRTKAYSLQTAGGLINSGFITKDYIRDRRREEIRAATPPINRAAFNAPPVGGA